jgi:hypothetical protein
VKDAARIAFGAHGQLAVGVFVSVVSTVFWVIGTITIPGALAWPWTWMPSVFIFHASMFALELAAWGIVATALGYKATERVEAAVIESVDEVKIER